MNKMKLCIAILFAAHGLYGNAMQQQCTITDLPPPVIRRITGFIDERSDRKAFANTCRYLYYSVATENKSLVVCCPKDGMDCPRCGLTAEKFLAQVFTCLQHIVARDGNNSIALHIDSNNLADDMKAVAIFLKKCSQSPIVQFIAIMNLDDNKFTSLPEEIKGLTYLKGLYLSRNNLGKPDLILLEKIINESLKRLERLNVDENMALKHHDIYQTIAHCPLKKISAYHLEGWHDFKPTPEEEQASKARFIAY